MQNWKELIWRLCSPTLDTTFQSYSQNDNTVKQHKCVPPLDEPYAVR